MDKEKYEKLLNAKRMLVVVDLLKGFVTEGKLADERIKRIIPETVRLVEEFLKEGDTVMFVKDAHKKDAIEFNHFPPHCIIGSKEAELVDELMPYEKDALVLEKNAISVAANPEYFNILSKMKNLEEVVGAGCEAEMCVMGAFIPTKSYFDQMNRNVDVIVPRNLIETFDGMGAINDVNKRAINAIQHMGKYESVAYVKNELALTMMDGIGISVVNKYERRRK